MGSLRLLLLTNNQRHDMLKVQQHIHRTQNTGIMADTAHTTAPDMPLFMNPDIMPRIKPIFFENNFYDTESEDLLFSIQSKAVNPPHLEKFSKEYATSLITQLKKEGILSDQ